MVKGVLRIALVAARGFAIDLLSQRKALKRIEKVVVAFVPSYLHESRGHSALPRAAFYDGAGHRPQRRMR